MWLTSAANGRLYAIDPQTWSIQHEFIPPSESLGITYTGSDFRLVLAPLIELDERGAAVREVQLERRPVGMTIVDGAFYLVTVDEDWGNGRFDRLGTDDDASSIQALRSLPFKPRSVAFDGEQFWTADRNNHAIVSFTLR
jgi:hypothetical protein